MSSSTRRRRGAPFGNINAQKHGFYTRRIKNRHVNGLESTDLKSLVDEIALIRVITRYLDESYDFSDDIVESVEILRILCLASSTFTRILRVNYLISCTENSLDQDIEFGIKQVDDDLISKCTTSHQYFYYINEWQVPSMI